MPYRRFPKTDQARLRCLQKAVRAIEEASFTENVIDYKTQSEAKKYVGIFETALHQYRSNVDSRVVSNKTYRKMVNNARMYISHFIQVLNMSVIRGEIKAEKKALYKLSVTNHTVPELFTEVQLLEWGKNIIEGEQRRIAEGGIALQNPSIAKVRVHYDIFKDNQINQALHRKSASRTHDDMSELRVQVDELLVQIWNQVDKYFADRLPYDRLTNCERYGMVFYYRTGQKHFTPETDKRIEEKIKRTLTLPLE